VSGHSPLLALTRRRFCRLAPNIGQRQAESRGFANYLSIGDRYSAQTNFDSENTIGGHFRVNRAYKRDAVFLLTVFKQQQWQIGDSLLNLKFGRLVQRAYGLRHGTETLR